jgi:tRNA-2-methylthio-N6-dimethylallyladenosine synthase
MNLSDTEIVKSVLEANGYSLADSADAADIILMNTCSVRQNAERRVYERLNHLKFFKKKNKRLIVGILGCMAERMRETLIEDNEILDLVVGPDEYRRLPSILENVKSGNKTSAVRLDKDELYDNIEPVREDRFFAWISIMRGCNNFCSYCVVPFTRGRERSLTKAAIVREVEILSKKDFREITLLGQNVNSYFDHESGSDFAYLLEACSRTAPNIRFRFTTSHPKDLSEKLLFVIRNNENICKHIHLPVQSGSDRILELMNRKYTSAHYLEIADKIRSILPDCSITTDIIAGFPSETEEDHQVTMRLMEQVQFDSAFMFRYSPRENTAAFKFDDDVPEETKLKRLNEIISLQNSISKNKNQAEIGRIHEILTESPAKRSDEQWQGRTGTNKVVIFPIDNISGIEPGKFFKVIITRATSATLFGQVIVE